MKLLTRARSFAAVAALTVAAIALSPLPARAISRVDLENRIVKMRTSLDALADALGRAEEDLYDAQVAVDHHAKALAGAAKVLETLRDSFGRRTAELYINGEGDMLQTITSAESIDVLADRLGFLERLRSSEEGSLEQLVALKRRARTETADLGRARDRAAAALRALSGERRSLDSKLREYQSLLGLVNAYGGRVPSRASRFGLPGFHCPVAGPHALMNDFGAPRPGGPHQGDDMPADTGTPLVSVLTTRVVSVVHGGWMGRGIILRDGGGNEYYYAHLSASYVSSGEALAPGEMLGRVGCSGHCSGPHLHFEYHPGGGHAVNPYRILRAAC